DFLSMGRRYILANYVAVDIVGLNSCRLEQKHFAGYGYVSREQLKSAASEMGWWNEDPNLKFRIVSLHHHLIPVTPVEEFGTYGQNYSLTLDAAQLIYELLRLDADVVAH